MFLSEWCEFPSAPCLVGKRNLMTARVSILLKSRASLTCFRACFYILVGLSYYQHPGKHAVAKTEGVRTKIIHIKKLQQFKLFTTLRVSRQRKESDKRETSSVGIR